MFSKSTVHCFTSASFAYIDRARTLFHSLRRHHPDWILWLCLVDCEPEGFHFDPELEPFDHLVRMEELDIDDLYRWSFLHDIVELCTAVKGKMLCHILNQGAGKVFFLDPDIAVFSSLEPLVNQLDHHDILLTPHLLQPEESMMGIGDNEISALKYGIFNLGFVGVANRKEGNKFAQWWHDRLLHFCYDDVANGIFTDQKWINHVPVFFPSTAIIYDEGYNVACWNLNMRPLSTDNQNNILAGNKLLRFFHFTKINSGGDVMLERYGKNQTEIFELIHWYRHQLQIYKPDNLPDRWWAYNQFNDGTPIQSWQRKIYRQNKHLYDLLPNPFEAGPQAFAEFAPKTY